MSDIITLRRCVHGCLTAALLLAACAHVHAQPFQSAIGLGNTEISGGIIEAADGNYMAVGYTTSFSVVGQRADVYVAKLNPCGQLMWGRAYDLGGDEMGKKIRATPDGGYVIVGVRDATGNLDDQAFLLKIDGTGTMLWRNTYGASGPLYNDVGNDVRVDPVSGDIFACGQVMEADGKSYGWVWKTTSGGALLWSKYYRTTNGNWFVALDRACNGSLVAVGAISNGGTTGIDMFEVGVDEGTGAALWNAWVGRSETDIATTVAVDAAQGQYWVGGTTATAGVGGLKEVVHSATCDGVRLLTNVYGDVNQSNGMELKELYFEGRFGANLLYGVGTYYIGSTTALYIERPGFWSKRFGMPGNSTGASVVTSNYVYLTGWRDIVAVGSTPSYGSGGVDFYAVGTDWAGASGCSQEDNAWTEYDNTFSDGTVQLVEVDHEFTAETAFATRPGGYDVLLCTNCAAPPPPDGGPIFGGIDVPKIGRDVVAQAASR